MGSGKSMGAFNLSKLPEDAVVAGAGVGLMFLSSMLPPETKPFTTMAGLGLIGYAMYDLFSGPPGAGDVPKTTYQNVSLPAWQTADMVRRIGASIVSPPLGQDVDLHSFIFGMWYPIKASITNNFDRALKLNLELRAEHTGRIGGSEVKSVTDQKEIAPGQTVEAEFHVPTSMFSSDVTATLLAATAEQGQWLPNQPGPWRAFQTARFYIPEF